MEELQLEITAIDGEPLGIIKYVSFDWQGMEYKIPRSKIFSKGEIIKSLFDKTCVYILVGEFEGKDAYYIGEAEKCIDRIKQHKSEDWWHEVLVFFGSVEFPLDKAQIKYIEHVFYKEAKENEKSKKFIVMNDQTPTKSSLDSRVRVRTDKYVAVAKKITLLENFKLFYKQSELVEDKVEEMLTLSRNGQILAYGNRTNNGFIVKKGAVITKEMTDKTTSCFKEFRKRLVGDGVIKNGKLMLDYEFSSPSAAAVQILGHNCNGLDVWKNTKGKTLKQLER